MACYDKCPKAAIIIEDACVAYNAIIDEEKCINCNLCNKVCQHNNTPEFIKTQRWFQGWSSSKEIREITSSGGAATELSRYIIENHGCVCGCVFSDGIFGFEMVNTIDDLPRLSGSKYVKSNPVGAYKKVLCFLQTGKKVLFIGLPCQVAAMKNYVGEKYEDTLYLVDLICHGSPSPKILELYLKSEGCSLTQLQDIRFRKKANFQLHRSGYGFNNHISIVPEGMQDLYSFTFLNEVCYTENCYSCKYAKTDRVSDVTLGDSWGSRLTDEEKKKGISLVMCQSDKGLELVKKSGLKLEDVDIEQSIAANQQLQHPSQMPEQRKKFIEYVCDNKNFKKAFLNTYPKEYWKHIIKRMLITMKLIRGGEVTYSISVLKK